MRIDVFTDRNQLADRRELTIGETIHPMLIGTLAVEPLIGSVTGMVRLQRVGLSQYKFVGRVVSMSTGEANSRSPETKVLLDCGIPITLIRRAPGLVVIGFEGHPEVSQTSPSIGSFLSGVVQVTADISFPTVARTPEEFISTSGELVAIKLLECSPSSSSLTIREVPSIHWTWETSNQFTKTIGAILGISFHGP